jgi:hypothetical protein
MEDQIMHSITRAIFPTLIALFGFSAPTLAVESCDDPELWICRGYCFMGGDTPTNPWIPVSSEGSSEQEARDNIDCGRFEEVNIRCTKV